MKTLELFNAVIAKESNRAPFVSSEGLVIDSKALWAKDRILKFYSAEMLSGYGLNKTFHKSWLKIQRSSTPQLKL